MFALNNFMIFVTGMFLKVILGSNITKKTEKVTISCISILRRHYRLVGHPLQVRQKQECGRKGLSFYYLRQLYCPNQLLTVMVLDLHLSSKTIRPHASYGALCMSHVIWSCCAVGSGVLHSQFVEGARRHLHGRMNSLYTSPYLNTIITHWYLKLF